MTGSSPWVLQRPGARSQAEAECPPVVFVEYPSGQGCFLDASTVTHKPQDSSFSVRLQLTSSSESICRASTVICCQDPALYRASLDGHNTSSAEKATSNKSKCGFLAGESQTELSVSISSYSKNASQGFRFGCSVRQQRVSTNGRH